MGQDVLRLARQGDARSIALLINQAFEPRGVRVRALRQQNCLHILLEATQVPHRKLARFVRGGVVCLGNPSIQLLRVYGRQTGAALPAWTQEWTLCPAPIPASQPPIVSATAPPLAQVQRYTLSQPQHSAPSQAQPQLKAAEKPARVRSLRQGKQRFAAPVSWQKRKPKLGLLVPIAFSAGIVISVSWHYLAAEPPEFDPGQTTAKPQSSQASTIALTPTVTPATAPPASAEPVRAVTVPSPAQPALTIKAVGDMILGTNFPNDRLPDQDGVWLFDSVKPFFDGADILFGNFESTLTDYPNTAKDISQGQTFAFRTPPFYANLLQQLGFDMLSVANNHSLDFGDQGFADTIAHIQQTGMQAVGQKQQIVYTTVKGVNVAFIGFSYFPEHNSLLDLEAGRALVETAKQQASIVVISVHAGAEGTDARHTRNETEYFFGENRGNLVEFSHAMIDQGADLILGHGPHIPRAMELYKSRLIAYSLGNFVGYRTLSTDGALSYSLILDAQLSDQGEFVTGRIIPVRLNDQGVPFVDDNFKSVSFVRNLIESDFPVTPLLIDESGNILRNEAPLPAT